MYALGMPLGLGMLMDDVFGICVRCFEHVLFMDAFGCFWHVFQNVLGMCSG